MRNTTIVLVLLLLIGSVSFATTENLITDGKDFHKVTSDGYAAAALPDQSGGLLLQAVTASVAGEYDFAVDYRLADASDMFSIVRVFTVDDRDADFSLSYLSSSPQWTNVSGSVNVAEPADYLRIHAAFSSEGSKYSRAYDFADLDNFSLTADDGISLGTGGFSLLSAKRN